MFIFQKLKGVSTSIKTFSEELTELGHKITLIAPGYANHTDIDLFVIRIYSRYFFNPEDRLIKRKSTS